MVGQTYYRVDPSKLEREELEMNTFLNGILGHKIRAVVTLLVLSKFSKNKTQE